MAQFDVFNGDADGICALHQLRLAYPVESTLITGVKRDIALLDKVSASSGDKVTVLDISLDKNRAALESLLHQDVIIEYYDHHFAGDIPEHPGLTANINTAPDVCTSLLVNGHLQGKYLDWAVTAAFGDNLYDSARSAARSLELTDGQLELLKDLGTFINYNGYGAALEDLYFHPADLYKKIKPYENPFQFIEEEAAYRTLSNGFTDDITRARAISAEIESTGSALFIFPNASWARRVSGVYSNELAREYTSRAHALLTEKPDGGYVVSVRAPMDNKEGADDLCRQFATGGGRKAAAGINHLPGDEVDDFIAAFQKAYP
jgi:hypothetical protein